MPWQRVSPEEARVRLVLLKEGVRRKVGALEARLAKKKAPLEKALAEYRKVLEHLRRLEKEGRYPEAVLRSALAREELRIRYAEQEITRLEEAHRQAASRIITQARLKAARLAALAKMEEALDHLFPLPEKEESHA
ncbi:MAG: hypothetical protein ACP5JV_08070 [Thermus sp.]|uniref:hypothetical protein n=1 Tax=Thermus sp. TaxID=275 RepID=UPI003D144893